MSYFNHPIAGEAIPADDDEAVNAYTYTQLPEIIEEFSSRTNC